MAPVNRRAFLAYFSAIGLSSSVLPGVLYGKVADGDPITAEVIAQAEVIAGVEFTDAERQMMVEDLNENLDNFEAIRELQIPNDVPPSFVFDPGITRAEMPDDHQPRFRSADPELVSQDDLAFASLPELGALLRTREVTSVELTEFFLERLRRYDDTLHLVVTFAEERAMEYARRADEELDEGHWRGPLHGIPYGAKDLFAVEEYPTTWGATPFQDQQLDTTATVIERLDDAGAVLTAKLTLGALAWGDVWFGGTTRNPWNPEQGASGSSAGSGAAVAAGLVPFALGTETLGSIVSPSTRNGVTGHRPTFGGVSRYGAMALSWTMDKVGPMARSAEDCALVYDAIRGADKRDPASWDLPFPYDVNRSIGELRIGYVPAFFDYDGDGAEADQQALSVLREHGAELTEINWPDEYPVSAMVDMLNVEAAAAFDELTRTRRIDDMVRQERNAWPHVFRTARFTPAVEYVQMARARTQLMHAVHEVMEDVDVMVTPSFQGGVLATTNLTGHPCVVVPNRFDRVEDGPSDARSPGSISFIGALYRDDAALDLATIYQHHSDFHQRRPPL